MPARSSVWKIGSMVGICLAIVGIGAGYVDDTTHFRFEFLSDDFSSVFGSAVLVDVITSFICIIGWARHLAKSQRLRAVGIVFVSPWIVALLGYPIDGFNAHGQFALLAGLVEPAASILALVLLIMAGSASRPKSN